MENLSAKRLSCYLLCFNSRPVASQITARMASANLLESSTLISAYNTFSSQQGIAHAESIILFTLARRSLSCCTKKNTMNSCHTVQSLTLALINKHRTNIINFCGKISRLSETLILGCSPWLQTFREHKLYCFALEVDLTPPRRASNKPSQALKNGKLHNFQSRKNYLSMFRFGISWDSFFLIRTFRVPPEVTFELKKFEYFKLDDGECKFVKCWEFSGGRKKKGRHTLGQIDKNATRAWGELLSRWQRVGTEKEKKAFYTFLPRRAANSKANFGNFHFQPRGSSKSVATHTPRNPDSTWGN